MGNPPPHQFAHGQQLRVETLDWPEVYGLTTSLVTRITEDGFVPELVVGILDPESAGGYTVAALLASLLGEIPNERSTPIATIRVEGRSGARGVSRIPVISTDVQRILVVDDVSWSGSTLHLACQALSTLTQADIRTCTLLAGPKAIQAGNATYYGRSSTARDAMLPWGLVTPTAEIRQFFEVDSDPAREVSWAPRPWGYWEQFALNEPCTVRILTIFPGEYLSLQYHNHRDEFFIALDDGVVLQIGDRKLTARQGDYILIPRGTTHRQFAPGDRRVRVLEISFGSYDQVGDIVRLEDKYGRLGKDGAV
jgi:mannose-6-phosphate isomerase